MCGGGIFGSANDEQTALTGLLFHNNTAKPTNHARPSEWGALKLFPSNTEQNENKGCRRIKLKF